MHAWCHSMGRSTNHKMVLPLVWGVAGQVANIYLSSFDNFLMQSCDNYLQFLRRYIDDLLLLWSGSALELSAIANSWHPSLKFDLSGDGNVHFLDVALHIEHNRSVSWAMYEKPLNLHLYVPANSCHPDSVLSQPSNWRILEMFAQEFLLR